MIRNRKNRICRVPAIYPAAAEGKLRMETLNLRATPTNQITKS